MRTARALAAFFILTAFCHGATPAQKVTFDGQFLKRAASDSLFEIQLGLLAQANSRNAAIQSFGEKLVADHSLALDQAEQLAQQMGTALPDITPQQQNALERLGLLMGERFDREFLNLILRVHLKDISLFRTAAQRAKSAEVRALAREQLPVILNHLLTTFELRQNGQSSRSGR